MLGSTLTLFRIRGFEIRIDLSWFIVFSILIWSLAADFLPRHHPGLSRSSYWTLGAALACAIFLSILAHELAHAIVARRKGLRVSSFTLFVLGSVTEMTDDPPSPRHEILFALTGPAVSVALGALFMAFPSVAIPLGADPVAASMVGYLGAANLLIAAFNLIPVFPLDGGRALRGFLWKRGRTLRGATRIATSLATPFALILMTIGVVRLVQDAFVEGLWWILVGYYVRSAAHVAYNQLFIRDALRGEVVRSFMTRDPVTVLRSISIRELVDTFILRFEHKLYPVLDEERLVGCITTEQVRRIPQEQWPHQTVGTVAEECSKENSISPETDAIEALARMGRRRRSRLMVVEDGRLVGVLTLKDLIGFLASRMALDEANGEEAE